jgi:hypothetical protein
MHMSRVADETRETNVATSSKQIVKHLKSLHATSTSTG